MDILNKIDFLLCEDKFKENDWIAQKRSDATAYAVVIGELKNGTSKVISCDDDRMVATLTNIRNWHPAPKMIKKSDVPADVMKKMVKKAQTKNLKI